MGVVIKLHIIQFIVGIRVEAPVVEFIYSLVFLLNQLLNLFFVKASEVRVETFFSVFFLVPIKSTINAHHKVNYFLSEQKEDQAQIKCKDNIRGLRRCGVSEEWVVIISNCVKSMLRLRYPCDSH